MGILSPELIGAARTAGGSVDDPTFPRLPQRREARLHRPNGFLAVSWPVRQLPHHPNRLQRAIGARRMAGQPLVGDIRIVLELPGRLDRVGAGLALAPRELGAP